VDHNCGVVRKVLISTGVLVLCIVALLLTWVFGGRHISLFIDRFGTVEAASTRINSIAYEGSGNGGVLTVNTLALSLNNVSPKISLSIGSTKDNQVALASSGKVFAFGPPMSTSENAVEQLATTPQPGDEAVFVTRRSVLSWPTPFDLNFMTGHSPSWKRHIYYQILWKKSSGSTLDMLWRYEQYFHPGNGWGNGFMTRQDSTGLVKLEIHP
jgi:hypothetical protein